MFRPFRAGKSLGHRTRGVAPGYHIAPFQFRAAETQRLARLYERKHAALEALKKSLLHQAFTGEL